MRVVVRKPVPVYESECMECGSIIQYTAAETNGYIRCPVCNFLIKTSTLKDSRAGYEESEINCYGEWIPFTKRELTAEEQEEHPEWCYIMECQLPDYGQEILVSDGKRVWQDEFYIDDGCYLDSDHDLEGCAWMPLPEPYKEGKQ